MGEAKQKHRAMAQAACRCGSEKLGRECCWREWGWHKSPAVINLTDTGYSGSHPRCYLNALNSCSEKLSREHVISATVLKAINQDAIDVSGFPWIKAGETKRVGVSSLVANCLCAAHNHVLSPLDAVAGQFYRALQSGLGKEPGKQQRYLFSGHDVERWLLKTLAGMAASRNLSSQHERLPGLFNNEISVPSLLENALAWKAPLGMYSLQRLGQRLQLKNGLEIAPLSAETKELGGMITLLHGLTTILVAVLVGAVAPRLD